MKKFTCSHKNCDQSFDSEHELLEHVACCHYGTCHHHSDKAEMTKKLTCPHMNCQETFNTSEALEAHAPKCAHKKCCMKTMLAQKLKLEQSQEIIV